MELEVSAKTGGFSNKPLIKKGYYPAQLTSIEELKDKDGKLIKCSYGYMLKLDYAIYKGKGDNDEPTTPIKYLDPDTNVESDTVITQMVYHIYIDKKTNEAGTAITANSAITKTLKALGWKFDASKKLEMNDFIGNWAIANIDDYTKKDSEGEETTYSSIKEIQIYKGAKPSIGIVKDEAIEEIDMGEDLPSDLKKSIADLKVLLDNGNLSQDGFDKAVKTLKERKNEKSN